MAEHVELRLIDARSAPGQINLGDLGHLAGALDLLVTRIGRDLAGLTGPGRTPEAVERAAQLSLTGVGVGSTRLVLTSFGSDALDVEDELSTETFERFWQVIQGLGRGERPAWVTARVGDAVLRLTSALSAAARACEFTGRRGDTHRPSVRFDVHATNRSVWHMGAVSDDVGRRSVAGVLDLVDLRTGRFRVRDDLGNDIGLDEVDGALEAASWIGQRVTGKGLAEVGSRGQIVRLMQPTVRLAASTNEWTSHVGDLEQAFANRQGPGRHGIEGVDDDEVAAFLVAIRG